jgi:hypothetical protein
MVDYILQQSDSFNSSVITKEPRGAIYNLDAEIFPQKVRVQTPKSVHF